MAAIGDGSSFRRRDADSLETRGTVIIPERRGQPRWYLEGWADETLDEALRHLMLELYRRGRSALYLSLPPGTRAVEGPSDEQRSPLSLAWERHLGPNVIPYAPAERRRRFPDAFKALDRYITAWENWSPNKS